MEVRHEKSIPVMSMNEIANSGTGTSFWLTTKFSPELNSPAVWMKKQTQALTAMMFSKSWNMNPGKEACYEYLSLLYQRCRHTV